MLIQAPLWVGSHAVPPAVAGMPAALGNPTGEQVASTLQAEWLRWRRLPRLRVMPTRWSGDWAVASDPMANEASRKAERNMGGRWVEVGAGGRRQPDENGGGRPSGFRAASIAPTPDLPGVAVDPPLVWPPCQQRSLDPNFPQTC